MASTSVTSGNVQPGGTLSSGDMLYILNGGTATQTVVLKGGQEIVSSGGTAFSGTISSGGDEIVSGGGEDLYGNVQAGGTLDFFAGGIGSGTIIESGGTLALNLVTVASGTVITAGPRTATSAISGIELSAGAIVEYDDVTVASGATVRVASGGTVSGAAVLSGGTVNVVSHGSAAGLTVGGQLYDLGGTVSGATILSGGQLEVVSSTLDLNTGQDVAQSSPISTVSVSSGGTFQVDGALNGAQAVAAGAGVVVSGGATYRLYQATIDDVAVIDRQISATVISGGLTLLSGAVATTVSALVEGSGTLTISSGVIDSASTAGDGGRIIVSSGGIAIDDKAIYLGGITILSGGIASGLVVNGSNTDRGIIAGITVMSGGIVSGGEIQLGSAVVEPGANIAGLSIGSRSTLVLTRSVIAAGQTVREGATASARAVSGATLSSGALLGILLADVQSGGTLVLANRLTRQLIVEAGGLASGGGAVYDPFSLSEIDPTSSFVAGTVIGTELDTPVVVQSGGVLSSVTAAAAPGATVGTFTIGAITIQAGGLASGLTLTTSYGGIPDLTVQSGGHASTVVLNGGNATALAGSVVSGLTANYGRFTLSGTASATVLGSSGQEAVSPGAVDTGGRIGSGGVQTVFASGLAAATTVSSGGTQTVSSGGTASAAIVLSGGLQFIAANGTATGTDITGGGTIDIDSLAYAAGGTALFDPLADAVTIDENGTFYTQQLSGDYTGDQFNLAQASDGSTLLTMTIACYCPGTLILTTRGEVAVEDLAVGDLVVTASGGQRPIVWLGHRTLPCHTHPNRRAVLPVRISAHALGHNKPRRDLFVSPGHAIAVDVLGEVLIPAATLVNGTTIQQVEMDQVTYWHVELGSHDLLLADNLAAESYLDMGNRSFFGESGVVTLDALPDGDPAARTPADFCRPFHSEGPLVTVVRSQLRRRALDAGWTLDGSDPFAGLHLVIDGVRTEPACRGLVARFSVPAGAQDVWLVSSTVRPCEVRDEADSRDLGVCLRRLTVDDGFGVPQEIALDDPLLGTGLHAPEDGVRRWTAGPARLPAALWPHAPDGFFLRVELNGPALPRWVAPSDAGRRSVRVPVAGGPEPVALAG